MSSCHDDIDTRPRSTWKAVAQERVDRQSAGKVRTIAKLESRLCILMCPEGNLMQFKHLPQRTWMHGQEQERQ